MESVRGKVFGALSTIFSSEPILPLAVDALRLITVIERIDFAEASCELFHVIMASDNMTEEYWEAARYAIRGAFRPTKASLTKVPVMEKPQDLLEFLDHHFGLQGAGEDHISSITCALEAALVLSHGRPVPLVLESIRSFNCASPSFVRGMRSIMRPPAHDWTRENAIRFIALVSDQWFNSPMPIMEQDDRTEFCENLAWFMAGSFRPHPYTRRRLIIILFGMLRSPEWRNHIVAKLWSLFGEWTLADEWTLTDEEDMSFQWCLKNAIELLEFTKGSPDAEKFRWWYGTLWFHFEKLDPTVQGEVERIATEMSSGAGLSDLNLYLNLIGQETERSQRQFDGLTEDDRLDRYGMELRARIVWAEGNYRRLARIAGRL